MNIKRFLGAALAVMMLACPCTAALGTSEPIVLTCWVYYNGVQEQQFDRLLEEFNDTVGLENGIFVESHSWGGVSELSAGVSAAAAKEPGSEPLPDMFASYADTAYEIWQLGQVASLSDYMSQEDLDVYIDAYIEEGRMGDNNDPCIFPSAKSTELLLLNQTEWEAFATATGADAALLATWEGIVELSRMYFEWTDAKTPDTVGDGSAFFGRDAMANYMLIGSLQLGKEIFDVTDGQAQLQFDRDIMKKLWDNFYVPFASGWFGAYGRFRSDDIKTGQILALVGSTSGALYFPSEVTNDDGTTHPIECSVYDLPNFEGTQPMATQQGAGFVVTKSTPEREQAAVTFLEWLTQPERNTLFSINSGYLPVSKAANEEATIQASMESSGASQLVRDVVGTGVQIATSYTLYTNKPFRNGVEARSVLENAMLDAAKAAEEERKTLMEQGTSYEDAVTELTSEARFDAWYQATLAQLESVLNK